MAPGAVFNSGQWWLLYWQPSVHEVVACTVMPSEKNNARGTEASC